MKLLKPFVLLMTLLIILSACGEEENSSVMGTAEVFVQALIDGDEETLEKLSGVEADPSSYILQEYGPEFSGLNIEDFVFELEEENKVKIIHEENGERLRYWLRIDKVGEEYFVNNM